MDERQGTPEQPAPVAADLEWLKDVEQGTGQMYWLAVLTFPSVLFMVPAVYPWLNVLAVAGSAMAVFLITARKSDQPVGDPQAWPSRGGRLASLVLVLISLYWAYYWLARSRHHGRGLHQRPEIQLHARFEHGAEPKIASVGDPIVKPCLQRAMRGSAHAVFTLRQAFAGLLITFRFCALCRPVR